VHFETAVLNGGVKHNLTLGHKTEKQNGTLRIHNRNNRAKQAQASLGWLLHLRFDVYSELFPL
jgi:hypothetical protein